MARQMLIIHGCTDDYAASEQGVCAELIHDQLLYNVSESVGLARAIARGERVSLMVPPGLEPELLLHKFSKLGLNCAMDYTQSAPVA